MKIKILPVIFCFILLAVQTGYSSGHYKGYNDPLLKTFIGKSVMKEDPAYQQHLRQQPSWQRFIAEHGQWNVIYNQSSAMPHRAFGTPVSVGGYDDRSTAWNFLTGHLQGFNIPVDNLEFRSVSVGTKYTYVNYYQMHNGLEVLFSNVQVKMTHDFRVMQFALDCYPSITLNTLPALSEQLAIAKATQGVLGITSVSANQDLKVLPIPAARSTQFRLVY